MILNQAIENCRKRWLKAKKANDQAMMKMWEGMGKLLKKFAEEKK